MLKLGAVVLLLLVIGYLVYSVIRGEYFEAVFALGGAAVAIYVLIMAKQND